MCICLTFRSFSVTEVVTSIFQIYFYLNKITFIFEHSNYVITIKEKTDDQNINIYPFEGDIIRRITNLNKNNV